jgi:hypothetical protein
MQKQTRLQLQNLNFADKQALISSFPNIKLCYDNVIHNKVEIRKSNNFYDVCSAIPCGKKCFAWFTQIGNKNVCLILELINKKNINDIKIYNCVFNNDLVYGKCGTILYGTLFHYSQTPFFTIEDIFYWKGNDISNNSWYDKLNILMNVFENDIKQITYNNTFVVFGLPLMSRDLDELKRMIEDIEYKIYNIQFRLLDKVNIIDSVLLAEINNMVKFLPTPTSHTLTLEATPKIVEQPIPTPTPRKQATAKFIPKEIVFKVKPDIQNDIYHLHCMENHAELFYNIAYIPDYKTSVMMNKLFRNIKENENLDLLEESDDEDEFQNENVDRFVDMNKSLLMICKFNHKFKKWYPVKEFLGQKPLIVEKQVLPDYEKNNYSSQYRNNSYNSYNRGDNKKQYQPQYNHQKKTNYRK